jgi:hypothetical protein
MPEAAELALEPPPGFRSAAEFKDALERELAARERIIAAVMAAEGRRFLGVPRVLSQRPTARPTTEKKLGKLNPHIASRDRWKRIEALASLVEFRRAYRAAWRKLKAGVRDVVFPAGTYWLRVAHAVPCEAAA